MGGFGGGGSTTHTVRIVVTSQDNSSGPTDKASSAFEKLKQVAAVAGLALGAVKIAQEAIKAVKFGAEIQRQANSLNALATAAGTSGSAIVSAIQGASAFTIDRMTAMQAATKAMLLDVAESPEVFARLTKVATTLGRAMGQDAATSIDDFVTAAGRQSKQIADNLGLMVSAADANRRFAQANGISAESLDDAQKKQAFLNEMLRQGEIKMAAMGDQTLDAAGKIEKTSAAFADAKAAIGEFFAKSVEQAGILDVVATGMRAWADTTPKIMAFLDAGGRAVNALNGNLLNAGAAVDSFKNALNRNVLALGDTTTASEQLRFAHTTQLPVLTSLVGLVEESGASFDQYQAALDSTAAAAEQVTIAEIELAAQQVELNAAMVETQGFILDQTMSWKTHFDDVREGREEFSDATAQAEAEHQANLAGIQEKGQAVAIQINASAEEEKLATLKDKLGIALLQQSEFTDKTKESSRKRKEQQIATLEEEVAEQESLLTSYYDGTLVRQGQNIDKQLAAEDNRYADQLDLMQEEQKKQEQEQRQSLGRMVIQSFEAWAQMKQIPADKMLEMRTAIAQEYGLIDENTATTVNSMVQSWETWSTDFSQDVDVVIAQTNAAIDAATALGDTVNSLPTSHSIDIVVNVNGQNIGVKGGPMMSAMGEDLGSGLATGIDKSIPAVNDAVDNMTSAVTTGAGEALGVQSKSTVFAEFGRDVVRGFVQGVEEESETLDDAMQKIFDFSEEFERVGSTAANAYEEEFIDPLKEDLDGLTERMDSLRDMSEDLDKTIDFGFDKENEKLDDLQDKLAIAGSGMADKLQGLENKLGTAIAGGIEKLSDLQDKLAVAMQKQSEFTDSTSASKRLAQELKIADIENDIVNAKIAQEIKIADIQSEIDNARLASEIKIADLQDAILTKKIEIAEAEEATTTALANQAEIRAQIVALGEQSGVVSRDIMAREEKLFALEKARADFAFVQQQLDLVRFAREAGVSLDVFAGLTFGADADLREWVEATTGVVEQATGLLTGELEKMGVALADAGDPVLEELLASLDDQLGIAQGNLDELTRISETSRAGFLATREERSRLRQTIARLEREREQAAQELLLSNAALDESTGALTESTMDLTSETTALVDILDGSTEAIQETADSMENLSVGVDRVSNSVNVGADAWLEYAAAIASVNIPDVLVPGSPPPLAVGLGEINNQLRQMALSIGILGVGSPIPVSGTNTGGTINIQNLNLPGISSSAQFVRETQTMLN